MEVGQHEQAMIAKYDAAQVPPNGGAPAAPAATPPADPPPAPPARPEYIPEKFWDAEKGAPRLEELAKSYVELEKARSKPAEKPAEGEGKPADGDPPKGDVSKVDMAALAQEFQTNGSLTPETYSKLESIGFGKDVVDAYIAGQQALAAQRDAKGYEVVGGKEAFDKIAAWAQTALSDAEKAAFDTAVQGPLEGMLLAVQGLKARYEAAFGREPQLTQGNNGGQSSLAPFASRAEMTAAMRDPRYRNDPAYRATVERRVALMPD